MRRPPIPFVGMCLCALLGCSPEPAPAGPQPAPAAADAPVSEAPPADSEPAPAEPAPAAQAAEPPPGPAFLGTPDAPLLARLRDGEVVGVQRGSGGRSLGFKLTLADGTRAYFKPEQSFSGANWYAEVAAYHIDRALGLGRVPVTVARRLPWAPLRKAARSDRRLSEVNVAADGSVRGALVAWLDGELDRASTPPGWENWVRVTPYSVYAVSPFQRPAAYTAALRERRARLREKTPATRYYRDTPEPARPALPAELSDLLLLDYLTHNIDRWGGDNGNVLTLRAPGADAGTLVFLDNGAGFFHGPDRQGLMEDRLAVQERFRRRSIAALRALDVDALLARMVADPLGPFLDADLAGGLRVRRDALLARVDALTVEHGADAVLAW